jgi:hypothetical protein
VAYQALSGWAIAGFSLGAGFTLLVVLCALISLYQGAPFFLYQWLVGIALVGVFVSLYAQRHVRNSEGVLAGARLAQWGFRLSLVSGLMYCSYYFVTGWAVCDQANAFVMEEGEEAGFFPRLRKGGEQAVEHNKAFLLTQPPSSRSGDPKDEASMRKLYDIPKDGSSGTLTQFRESSAVARLLFRQLAKDAEITPKGVQDWEYKDRSYVIKRVYHIKTKELEVDYLLVAQSAEAESIGKARKWFVNLLQSGPVPDSAKLTPIGEGMVLLRKRAADWIAQEARKLEEGSKALDFKAYDQTPWLALSPKDHQSRRERIAQTFAGEGDLKLSGFQSTTMAELPGKWDQVGDKIRVYSMIKFALSRANHPPSFVVEAVAELETTKAVDPARFNGEGPVDSGEWKLISLSLTAMSVPEDKEKKPLPLKK